MAEILLEIRSWKLEIFAMSGKAQKQQNNELQPRPPVVVILGHVDHGKTSLLDYIRKTKVAEKESGGITQHIGAYQVNVKGNHPSSIGDKTSEEQRKITFLDTPGHEAFSAMRSRGAKVADIAILVVAADDGVKPQTKEAISHIKKLELPVIAAITKIDKSGIQLEKIKKQLSDEGILVESWGGKIPSVDVSAKTGQGIDDLLDLILLVAEMEEFKDTLSEQAEGVIIESLMDANRGPTATFLVQKGVLKNKDIVLAESTYGTVKRMEDWQGNPTKEAKTSMPVVMTGLEGVPMVGEKWRVIQSLEEAKKKSSEKNILEQKKRAQAEVLEIGPGKKVLNIILKADVLGSLEAIRESLRNIKSEEVFLRVLKAEVGDINESDIKLASSAKAEIIGFRVKSSGACDQLAEQKGVGMGVFNIIYELIQRVRERMSNLLEPEIIRTDLAKLKVIALFKNDKNGQVVGAKVLSGKMEKGLWIDVLREEEKIGKGKVYHLQHEKEEADIVGVGKNAGILFRGDIDIELDDVLLAYREEKKRRTL